MTAFETLRELDYRNSDGIEVFLLWNPRTDETFISVSDFKSESEEMFPVSRENAADAFRHPYAYLAVASETLHKVAA